MQSPRYPKYSQYALNRHSHDRTDPSWLNKIKKSAQCVVFCKDRLLLDANYQWLTLPAHQEDDLYLGEIEGQHYFARGINEGGDAFITFKQQGYQFSDLRRALAGLTQETASLALFAKALTHWHQTHRFCGRCGYANRLVEAGHARRCDNNACRHMTFPRTDPAVIMLVTHTFDDGITRCLLGRQKSWPKGNYSTLAGFVDPGETLEQAVVREVYEEAGIIAERPEYVASQPWPFPASIMCGFYAQAKTTDISTATQELEDARWFSKAELRTFSEWGSEEGNFKLPRKDSISRFLIEGFLNE